MGALVIEFKDGIEGDLGSWGQGEVNHAPKGGRGSGGILHFSSSEFLLESS